MAKATPDKKKYSESLFTRKSVKYWIRLQDITEVICKIIPNLPIYVFKKEKDKEVHSIAAPITSIYFDSPDFFCYRSR
jgi:SPX domain protein involved in polyphosphate accumulation